MGVELPTLRHLLDFSNQLVTLADDGLRCQRLATPCHRKICRGQRVTRGEKLRDGIWFSVPGKFRGRENGGVPQIPPAGVSVPESSLWVFALLARQKWMPLPMHSPSWSTSIGFAGFKSRCTKCWRAAAARARVTWRQILSASTGSSGPFFTFSMYEATV